jgi:O-antigen/teichoic acid export membrane protein
MTLGWTLVVPRLIGADEMGLIATGMAVCGILQIALGAGTAPFVTREIVVAPGRAAQLVGTAMIARLLLAPVFVVAIVIWSALTHYSADGNLVLYLMGASTVLFLLVEPVQSYFQAIERMHYRALGDVVAKGGLGLIGTALAVVGLGAVGIAGGGVVTAGIVLVLSLRWARRYVRLELRTTWRDLRELARGSLAYWAGGVFFMIYLWVDTAMLSVMTNPTVVGWYSVPTRLFQTFFFLPGLIATVWLPRLVRASERSRHELVEESRTPIAFVLRLAFPIGICMVVSAPAVIHLLYGAGYAQAVPVLMILGIGLIPTYLNMLLGQIAVASNRQGRFSLLIAGAMVFNPALNAVLIPLTQHRLHNGAVGAAIALSATEALVACGAVAIVGWQVLGGSTAERVARAALASAGMWIVVEATRGAGPVISLAAGGVVLVALGWVCGAVSRDELRQVGVWLDRALARVRTPFLRRRRPPAATEAEGTVTAAPVMSAPVEVVNLGATAAVHTARDVAVSTQDGRTSLR